MWRGTNNSKTKRKGEKDKQCPTKYYTAKNKLSNNIKTWRVLSCPGRVSSSWLTSGTRFTIKRIENQIERRQKLIYLKFIFDKTYIYIKLSFEIIKLLLCRISIKTLFNVSSGNAGDDESIIILVHDMIRYYHYHKNVKYIENGSGNIVQLITRHQ